VTDPAVLHPELAPWGPELELRRPCFGMMDGGLVVSICCCARTTPEAAEAGVETATGYRGRGLAAKAVAAWAEAVIASGRVAFYSTSRENLASQAVARKLGAVEFGEDWSLA
jgi:predicted GNAT family acetyltransferase